MGYRKDTTAAEVGIVLGSFDEVIHWRNIYKRKIQIYNDLNKQNDID